MQILGSTSQRVLEHYDQPFEGWEKLSFVGQFLGVDRYKIRGQLQWRKDRLSATMSIHHTPGYLGNYFERDRFRDIPSMEVSSYTTIDLVATYKFDNGLVLRAGGRNIFDKAYPFVMSREGQSYDSQRVDVRGRVLLLEGTWDFGLGIG